MPKNQADLEKRLFAAAIFELRVLLSGHIDPGDKSPAGVAASFAYALHNHALAALDGKSFDVAQAIQSLARLEPELGSGFVEHLRKVVHNEA